jgi:hypothetical protein
MDYNKYNTMDSVYDTEDISSVVISLEELVSHPLFREYLQIPLFRQFWEQYPTVFRRYVESPLFQRFWMLPQFQMYFRNPVFFYKYIVPQVQIIAQTVVPTTGEDFNFGTTTTSRFNPYSTFGYTPRYNKWSVPMTESTFGRYPMTTTSHYKYLLEKMMNHLNMNKMGQHDITETFTDVKMLPNGEVKESTFGKMVDPITGQDKITVGDVKLVNEKIVPTMNFPMNFGVEGMTNKYQMNKLFGNTQTIKDILLKHIILNKIYGDRKVITPEVYETLFGEHKQVFPELYDMIFKHKNVMTPEILSTIFGQNKHVLPEVYETLFDTKRTITPEIFSTVFGENKEVTPELFEILFNGNKHVTPSILETIFGKKVYEPTVYGNLFGEDKSIFSNENEDVYNKYNVAYEPYTYNKMNKYTTSPLLTRMLKNKVFTPRMNMKTMEKFQVQKMIEEIQKEKMMEKLIKNKEHKTLFNMDTEIFPTMEEKLTHIPLTFTKPMVGSGIEQFLQQEKEIKY